MRSLRTFAAATISLFAATTTLAADSPILFPSNQFGNVDLRATQSGGATASLLESLGAKTDRFEPMSRFRDDDPIRMAGRSVGRLQIEIQDAQGQTGVATCTATLISDDTIITNAHCIPGSDGSRVLRAEIRLGYLRLQDQGSEAFEVDPIPIETHLRLDYSLLRVAGNPARKFAVTPAQRRAARDNESLYLIHHPGGQPQKLTRAYCRAFPDKAVHDTEVRHQCDTLPGSSGALIFALTDGAIVGLHHSGGLSPGDELSFNRGTDVMALQRHSKLLLPLRARPQSAEPKTPDASSAVVPLPKPAAVPPTPLPPTAAHPKPAAPRPPETGSSGAQSKPSTREPSRSSGSREPSYVIDGQKWTRER